MSIKAILWAIELPLEGKMTAKLALICIADYADENGFCWPSQAKLRQRVGCSARALRNALDWLEESKFIPRKERRRENGTRTSVGFLLALDQPADFADSRHINRQILPHQPADFAGHEPVIEPINSFSSLRSEKQTRAQSEFDRFWQLYPNKVGKGAAQAAFAKASKRIDFDTLMAGLRRYVAKTDDRPWCNPATWLNQDRWDDAPASAQPIKRGQAPPRHMTDLERIFYATLEPTDDRPDDFERNFPDVPRLPGS